MYTSEDVPFTFFFYFARASTSLHCINSSSRTFGRELYTFLISLYEGRTTKTKYMTTRQTFPSRKHKQNKKKTKTKDERKKILALKRSRKKQKGAVMVGRHATSSTNRHVDGGTATRLLPANNPVQRLRAQSLAARPLWTRATLRLSHVRWPSGSRRGARARLPQLAQELAQLPCSNPALSSSPVRTDTTVHARGRRTMSPLLLLISSIPRLGRKGPRRREAKGNDGGRKNAFCAPLCVRTNLYYIATSTDVLPGGLVFRARRVFAFRTLARRSRGLVASRLRSNRMSCRADRAVAALALTFGTLKL